MKFLKLSARHRTQYALCKVAIFILMIGMMFLSFRLSGVVLPSIQSQLSVGIGFIGVLSVFILAMLNRINILFKIKSMGFVIMFLVLLCVREGIDLIVWSVGLMSIPLLIDDMILGPIWMSIWYRDYE